MRNKYLLITVICSLILAALPFAVLFFLNDMKVAQVPVEIMDDSLYYYARAMEVAQEHFSIGNPYIFERRDDMTVAFFLADWIWALPLLYRLSLVASIFINQLIWFAITAALLFLLFRKFEIPDKYAPWAVAVSILSTYWYIARPISMQIVFPFFILFLISLLDFLREPRSRKNIALLAISSAASVYMYTYLAQIIAVVFALAGIASLFTRLKKYRTVIMAGACAALLAVPFALFSWKQVNHPLYFETLARIGLVDTHMIGFAALWYLLLAALPLMITLIVRRSFLFHELAAVALVTAGLMIATVSNVFSGKDLEVAVHIGRFSELWAICMLCVVVWKMYVQKTLETKLQKYVSLALAIILVIGIGWNYKFQHKVWFSIDQDLFVNEVYAEPLNWLAKNASQDSVILANDSIASYVPIMTESYVLFHPNAELYMMSDKEVEERYLASRIFQNISVENIKLDMRKYGGAGHTAHRHKVHNRFVKLCTVLRLGLFGKDCGTNATQYSLKGEKYFNDLKLKSDEYRNNQLSTLIRFKVLYIVFDKFEDEWELPISLIKAWENERFAIYNLP